MEPNVSGWVRFENTTPDSVKVASVSDRAHRLWFNAICYCSRAQSDGFVPAQLVLGLSVTATKATVSELVDAGLLEPVERGYQVHDYLDHNPSRARITEMKQAARDRTQRWRDGSGDEDVTRHNTRNSDVTPHARDRSYTDPVVVRLSERLAARVRANDPKANPDPRSARWLNEMRLLLKDRDGDEAEVARIIDWCQADSFWRCNILSPGKLRKKFTQLVLRSSEPAKASGRESASDLLKVINGGAS